MPINTIDDLTPRGREFVEMLPEHLREDENVLRLLDMHGKSADQKQADFEELVDQLFVQTAYGWGLDLWERQVGLPVGPSGHTNEQRRALILTKLRSNQAVHGRDFRSTLDAYSSSYHISLNRNTGVLAVRINYSGDSYEQEMLRLIVGSIIPAPLIANVIYDGFIVAISIVGEGKV